MEKLIACCGFDCAICEARIATMANDYDLRAKKAEQWNKQYNRTDITPEMINCTGCLEPGPKIGHCQRCAIRNCANSKGYKTCAACEKMQVCETLGKVISHAPEALENLKSFAEKETT
jgi:hypothetical protein